MNKEKRSTVVRDKVGKFAELAKSKNYSISIIKAACFIAGSQQMYDNFGDYPDAIDKCCELCEKYDDAGQMLQELLKLAGEDD